MDNITFRLDSWYARNILKIFDDMADNETDMSFSPILCKNVGKIEPPPSFQSFLATVTSIMWSTFGLFDVSVSH